MEILNYLSTEKRNFSFLKQGKDFIYPIDSIDFLLNAHYALGGAWTLIWSLIHNSHSVSSYEMKEWIVHSSNSAQAGLVSAARREHQEATIDGLLSAGCPVD